MSQPDLINAGIYEDKPQSNIYTALLGVSFLSLCVAATLLSFELKHYDNDYKADQAKAVVVPTVAPKPEVEVPAEPEPEAAPEGTPAATPAATPSATASADPDAVPMATPSATAAPATPAASGTAVPAPSGTGAAMPAPGT